MKNMDRGGWWATSRCCQDTQPALHHGKHQTQREDERTKIQNKRSKIFQTQTDRETSHGGSWFIPEKPERKTHSLDDHLTNKVRESCWRTEKFVSGMFLKSNKLHFDSETKTHTQTHTEFLHERFSPLYENKRVYDASQTTHEKQYLVCFCFCFACAFCRVSFSSGDVCRDVSWKCLSSVSCQFLELLSKKGGPRNSWEQWLSSDLIKPRLKGEKNKI